MVEERSPAIGERGPRELDGAVDQVFRDVVAGMRSPVQASICCYKTSASSPGSTEAGQEPRSGTGPILIKWAVRRVER